jgi:hypothetical protein
MRWRVKRISVVEKWRPTHRQQRTPRGRTIPPNTRQLPNLL